MHEASELGLRGNLSLPGAALNSSQLNGSVTDRLLGPSEPQFPLLQKHCPLRRVLVRIRGVSSMRVAPGTG